MVPFKGLVDGLADDQVHAMPQLLTWGWHVVYKTVRMKNQQAPRNLSDILFLVCLQSMLTLKIEPHPDLAFYIG